MKRLEEEEEETRNSLGIVIDMLKDSEAHCVALRAELAILRGGSDAVSATAGGTPYVEGGNNRSTLEMVEDKLVAANHLVAQLKKDKLTLEEKLTAALREKCELLETIQKNLSQSQTLEANVDKLQQRLWEVLAGKTSNINDGSNSNSSFDGNGQSVSPRDPVNVLINTFHPAVTASANDNGSITASANDNGSNNGSAVLDQNPQRVQELEAQVQDLQSTLIDQKRRQSISALHAETELSKLRYQQASDAAAAEKTKMDLEKQLEYYRKNRHVNKNKLNDHFQLILGKVRGVLNAQNENEVSISPLPKQHEELLEGKCYKIINCIISIENQCCFLHIHRMRDCTVYLTSINYVVVSHQFALLSHYSLTTLSLLSVNCRSLRCHSHLYPMVCFRDIE